MYAVIATGGKQYRVTKDGVLRVEKLDAGPGAHQPWATGGKGGPAGDERRRRQGPYAVRHGDRQGAVPEEGRRAAPVRERAAREGLNAAAHGLSRPRPSTIDRRWAPLRFRSAASHRLRKYAAPRPARSRSPISPCPHPSD